MNARHIQGSIVALVTPFHPDGSVHFEKLGELIDFHPEETRTDISQVLKYLTNAIKKRCTAFLISDFIDKEGFKDALTVANRKHDMVAIQVYDRRETELPAVGLMKIKDARPGRSDG